MRISDQVTEAGAVHATSASAGPLTRALQSFYRAYQKTAIYPPGQPSVPEALAEATTEFHTALRETPSISLTVSRDHLRVDSEPLAEATGAIRSLAILLHDLDVAALELQSGVTADELESFVLTLSKARKDGARGQALLDLMEGPGAAHIVVTPLDYRVLNFRDGAREGEEQQEEIWENLTAFLADSLCQDDKSEHTPELLASEIGQQIELMEGAGVGVLRKRIQRVSTRLSGMRPETRQAIRQRMASFLSALNPNLRQDLLRLDPAEPTDSLSFMVEMVDVLPEPDLLEALQRIGKTGARVSGQALTLMNKLLRISQERPVLASGLQDTLDKWGIPRETLEADSPALRDALAEVFRNRQHHDFNPKPYADLLEDLSRSALEMTDLPLNSRYGDPQDAKGVRLHAAAVAAQVLSTEEGEPGRAGLLGCIGAAADELIDEQRFDVVCDGAVSARSFILLKGQSSETRLAAEGFLGEFEKDSRIRHILDAMQSGRRGPQTALSLLGLGGARATPHVLNKLNERLHPDVTAALVSFAVKRGADEILPLIEARIEGGWSALRSSFGVLRELPPGDTLQLLETLLAHDDPRVRVAALRTLHHVDRRPGSPGRHLEQALSDPSPRVLALALRLVGSSEHARNADILADCVMGRSYPPVVRHVHFRERAARQLAGRGVNGIRLLCRCLTHLRRKPVPRELLVARSVAALLAEQPRSAGIDSSLRAWRFSPLGWLGRRLPSRCGSHKGRSQ